jgi:hypothetical protein
MLLAEFDVDQQGIHPLAGDRIEAVKTISVIDPDTGERILSSKNPVRWAQLLPLTLRAGDLAVSLEQRPVGASATQPVADPVAALAEEIGDQAVAEAEYA